MLALFPITFLFLTALVLRRYIQIGWRVSFLVAASLAGALLTLMTEVLSLFHAFSFHPLVFAWSISILMCGVLAICGWKNVFFHRAVPRELVYEEYVFLFFIVSTVVITGITAFINAPNNWDSMTYHLSRVEHWIQDKTIAYYPSHIKRQLFYCPWAEFAMAQLRILCARESVVNLLQWTAMGGSLAGVSLIVKELGGSRRAQFLACLMAVTLPVGVLESVSTQNDYVETFWLVCFVFFLLRITRDFKLLYVFSAGISLGLALLTKGNGYIFSVPFLIWFAAAANRLAWKKQLTAVLIILVCAAGLNAGYYQRNISAFAKAGSAKDDLLNGSFDYKILLGGVLRNLASEMDTPSYKINKLLLGAVKKTAGMLHIDFNDPRALFWGRNFEMPTFSRHEDKSGDFLHLAVFALVFILCWFMPKYSEGLRVYGALIRISGILFCWLLRYDPWISRFHLSLFILFSPAAGIFIDRFFGQKRMIWLGVIFFLYATPFLFSNFEHPWLKRENIWNLPRNKQYFIYQPLMEPNYEGLAKNLAASGCRNVGIMTGEDLWEYPLWALLEEQHPRYYWRIEHVLVRNQSAALPYPLGPFEPCALVWMADPAWKTPLPGNSYKKIWDLENQKGFHTAIYVPVAE